MNRKDKERIIQRYEDRLEAHGENIRALASGTPERRRTRFRILAEVGRLDGSKLLDLGCGLGDFYAFLNEQEIDAEYVGYDINPELIDRADDRFPDARFEVRDVQEDGIPEQFDFAVCSQTFNNRLQHGHNVEVVQDVLRRLHEATRLGVAMDFLTTYVDFEEDHLYYYDPGKIFAYCKELTKRVTLRHDYPLFEFTIYLYPDFEGWRNS